MGCIKRGWVKEGQRLQQYGHAVSQLRHSSVLVHLELFVNNNSLLVRIVGIVNLDSFYLMDHNEGHSIFGGWCE